MHLIERSICLSIVCCLFFSGCQRAERVTLAIDFSKASLWRYMLGVDITGNLRVGDTSREYASSLRTYLEGGSAPQDSNSVLFKTSQTIITSNFLSEQDRVNLTRELENNTLIFSPQKSTFEPGDTSLKTGANIGGWNLLRSFARVVPALPGSAVRVGSTWDRERSFPLETDHGNATGWLFQSFTLDSISTIDSRRCAFISWSFSYRIQPDSAGKPSLLDSLPLKGSGSGTALIDCTSKVLIKAHALFDVPPIAAVVSAKAPLKASWQESVHLELVN